MEIKIIMPPDALALKGLLTNSALEIINRRDDPNCFARCLAEAGRSLACLTAYGGVLYCLCTRSEARRRGYAGRLLELWQDHLRSTEHTTLQCLVALPTVEQDAMRAFFLKHGFNDIYRGEVYTFCPQTAARTRFGCKMLANEELQMPPEWRFVNYCDLTEAEKKALRNSDEFDYDRLGFDKYWDELNLQMSFACFCGERPVGYFSHISYTPYIASVPGFAAAKSFRGAGLFLLRHYARRLIDARPPILRLKVYFTENTTAGRKLFSLYTEEKYLRRAEVYLYEKKLLTD